MKRKKRITPLEREQRVQIKCLRKRLAWCAKTGNNYNSSEEQYSILPRALCDNIGNPNTGSKKKWTDKLETRYSVLRSGLPTEWKPDAVLLDGMFFINLKPLNNTRTMLDYSKLLFRRFLGPHYRSGVEEVHLLFDNPRNIFNPKSCEQQRRDARSQGHDGENAHGSQSLHSHYTLQPTSEVPRPWRGCIECRQCKRSLVEAIGLSLLRTAHTELRPGQKLIISGCFHGGDSMAAVITGGTQSHPAPEYQSSALEVDQRIWRHAYVTTKRNILMYSPDTDIYNIGLSMFKHLEGKTIVVQINPPHIEDKYIHLNQLLEKFKDDTDLACLHRETLGKVLQTAFIVSGCDYLSFFSGYGKAAFFNSLFQYSEFITGGECPGTLADTDPQNMEIGFQACMRLVGTCYFQKNLAGFACDGKDTPSQLYQSFSENNLKQWWDEIRSTCSERIGTEEDRPPTYTALYKHWKRVCWVSRMWNNSILEDPYESLENGEDHGWSKSEEGVYEFEWESPDVTKQVEETIHFLTKGCSCKQGCRTRKCGCVKKSMLCGPGCECRGCINVSHKRKEADHSPEEDEVDEEGSSSDSDSEQSDIETEVVTDFNPF